MHLIQNESKEYVVYAGKLSLLGGGNGICLVRKNEYEIDPISDKIETSQQNDQEISADFIALYKKNATELKDNIENLEDKNSKAKVMNAIKWF